MLSHLLKSAAASIALSLAIGTAHAAPALKGVVRVAADIVTVGDLIEDSGPFARQALFRAPDLGTTGSVPVAQVLDRARALGLTGIRTLGLTEIVVSRPARDITPEDQTAALAVDIATRLGTTADAIDITFDTQPELARADVAVATPLKILDLGLSTTTGRFDAIIQIDKGGPTERLRLRGQATEMVDIPTLNRVLQRGDIVMKDDIVTQRTPKRQAVRLGQVNTADIVGKAAKRLLRAGQPVAVADFGPPILVRKGDLVTLVVEMPGLMLTVRGVAQEPGAQGEQIAVLNEQSKRTVHGTVAGTGRVIVSRAAPTVASLARAAQ